MPGWVPLSVGYHGDDGGIFVESGKMKYYTNETFKESKHIDVFISYRDGTPEELYFLKWHCQSQSGSGGTAPKR